MTSAAILAALLLLLPATAWTIAAAHRWVTLLLVFLLCLPPLPIPLGDSGPHPAIAVFLIGLLAGALRLTQWKLPVPLDSIFLFIYPLVLMATVPLAAFYSGPSLALASLARVLLFSISIYVFFYTACMSSGLTAPPETALRRLFLAGAVSASFACLDFYFQFPAPAGFGAQFVWLSSAVLRRGQGFFYEASTLGNICAFFLVLVAVCLSRPSHLRPLRGWMLALGAPVFFAALILSFSRASVINLAVSLAVLLFLNRNRLPLGRAVVGLFIGVAAAALATYSFLPAVAEFYWIRMQASLVLLAGGNEAVLSGRLETWRYLLNFLLEHPEHAILGTGYKTLPYSDFIGKTVVADNAYLSCLVETGIIGLAALLLFHFAILRMGWRAATSVNRHAAFFGTWITCFWAGEMVQMFSGDLLTYWRVLPVYLWVLAMAIRHTSETTQP